MTSPAPSPSKEDFYQIAALCPQRWVKHYARSKLSSDPVYRAVANEVVGTVQPLLDIGCGIGLLAHYLHVCGHPAPVTGFDYDPRKIAAAIAMATRAGHQHLSFASGDARTSLPDFSGHVVILDILQFFTEEEQNTLLTAAAARVADGAKLIIRSGLRDDSGRFRITVLGDYLAKACFWMKAAPTRYPDAAQFQRVLTAVGLKVSIKPMWGSTPFNNFLIVAER
jgi:2-polyprenyl-3-methyl-5-hydroxy-6-metoxy-1,4-benzoquinol methylase